MNAAFAFRPIGGLFSGSRYLAALAAAIVVASVAPTCLRDVQDCMPDGNPLAAASPPKVLAACERLARMGVAAGEYGLGVLYASGTALPENSAEAARWYGLAADQGFEKAQFDLGLAYYEGQGVLQSFKRARGLWSLAAASGDERAQLILGKMYFYGQGLPASYSQAIAFFRLAAYQGSADARDWVGAMYESGLGVAQDPSTAVYWYAKAAAQGYPPAQVRLGILFANGWDVPQDYGKAYLWLTLAASDRMAGGATVQPASDLASQSVRRIAARIRDQLASVMTAKQLAQAQALIGEWRPEEIRPESNPSLLAQAPLPDNSAPKLYESDFLAPATGRALPAGM